MATSEIPRSNLLLIKDMTPMSRNFDCEVIVLQREGEPAVTRDGDSIYRYLVADKTGTIILSVWGEMGRDIKNGDILRISGVDNKLRVGRLYLSTPKSCKIKRVGQDTFLFVEKPNMSEKEYQTNVRPGHRPRHQENNNINSNNNNSNNNNRQQQHRGYQNNTSHPHPYNNNRGRGGHRGGYRGNHNRGGGNNNGNRYHQDLDNPV